MPCHRRCVAALPPPLFLLVANPFSVQDVVYHAQMVKVHSFILFEARHLGYVLPNKSTEEGLTRPWVKDTVRAFCSIDPLHRLPQSV